MQQDLQIYELLIVALIIFIGPLRETDFVFLQHAAARSNNRVY